MAVVEGTLVVALGAEEALEVGLVVAEEVVALVDVGVVAASTVVVKATLRENVPKGIVEEVVGATDEAEQSLKLTFVDMVWYGVVGHCSPHNTVYFLSLFA